MPQDVNLVLLAQSHSDTDWSKQISSQLPELHKSLKEGRKLVICTENGGHVDAEKMMAFNAQMVAETRVAQKAKLNSEKALTPEEFQRRVETYMRMELEVEPDKKFKRYLPEDELDSFLKNTKTKLPDTFEGRDEAYLAELELFRYARDNQIAVVGIDTGRGALANSDTPITEGDLEAIEHSRIAGMSKNALGEMQKLSNEGGGVVVVVNLGRAHLMSLQTMVNESLEKEELGTYLKVKSLSGIMEEEGMEEFQEILYDSPRNIQNTAMKEMQKAATTQLKEREDIAYNLGRRDPEYARNLVKLCKDYEKETGRLDQELNKILEPALTALGVDEDALAEMGLTTSGLKLAFIKGVKDLTDNDETYGRNDIFSRIEESNEKAFWGGKTKEEALELVGSDDYDLLEEAWNKKRNAILQNLESAEKQVYAGENINFEALKGEVQKAEKLKPLQTAAASLKGESNETRLNFAREVESGLQKIDFSNRTIEKIGKIGNDPQCKILNSKDGVSIKKEFQSLQPSESVRTALQRQGSLKNLNTNQNKTSITTGNLGY